MGHPLSYLETAGVSAETKDTVERFVAKCRENRFVANMECAAACELLTSKCAHLAAAAIAVAMLLVFDGCNPDNPHDDPLN